MRKKTIAILIVLIAIYANGVMAEEAKETQPKKLYVFSKRANILASCDMKSDPIEEVSRGQELEYEGEQGIWYKVKTDEKEGWIIKYLVSNEKLSTNNAGVENIDINLKKTARKRASSYSTAASARGMSQNNSSPNMIKYNLKAVKEMEDNVVPDNEVQKFINDKEE
jgi:hypothetical protein